MSVAKKSNGYGKSTISNALALGAFAVVTALILGSVFVVTKDRIDASRKMAEQRALLEVTGDHPQDNDILLDTLALTDQEKSLLNLGDENTIYVLRDAGEINGFIVPAIAPDAYSGNISMLIGMDISGKLLGVRVIEHKETPGLGDKIDLKKSDWILTFTGKSLTNPSASQWAVTKDGGQFDAFTGATITPRAVVNRVKSVLEYYQTALPELVLRANIETAEQSALRKDEGTTNDG